MHYNVTLKCKVFILPDRKFESASKTTPFIALMLIFRSIFCRGAIRGEYHPSVKKEAELLTFVQIIIALIIIYTCQLCQLYQYTKLCFVPLTNIITLCIIIVIITWASMETLPEYNSSSPPSTYN